MKKGPFRTRAETTHVKMPQAGPKRPVTITDLTHFLRQFTNNILLSPDEVSQYLSVRFDSFLVQMISAMDSRYPIRLVKIDPLTLELLPLFSYRQL